jgi:mRNA-degrading endonuclease RelE of RelBE toxin-antitoxin system
MKFKIEFATRAVKDLKSFSLETQKIILNESLKLETDPFPLKKKIKRIKGIKFPCFRLRIDFSPDSYRLFYGIEKDIIYVLRIISKKDADKIIRNIRRIDFPPPMSS